MKLELESLFRKLFIKNDHEEQSLPVEELSTFQLKVDEIVLATLHSEKGRWQFRYNEDFKHNSEGYKKIPGFSDLNKIYESDVLWPFFQTRIPGLKQPEVIEIIEKESINKSNQAALLKRFGKRSISNPFELEVV